MLVRFLTKKCHNNKKKQEHGTFAIKLLFSLACYKFSSLLYSWPPLVGIDLHGRDFWSPVGNKEILTGFLIVRGFFPKLVTKSRNFLVLAMDASNHASFV